MRNLEFEMKHLDEATIQFFLDGEMSDEAIVLATQHLAICERCANALMKAEAEQGEVNFAFAAEASSPVPSQRIWARIENEIDFLAVPKRNSIKVETKTFWQQLETIFTPAQISFAGGLAAVVLVSFFAVQVLRQDSLVQDKTVVENFKPESSETGLSNPAVASRLPVQEESNIITTPEISSRPVKVLYSRQANLPKTRNPNAKIRMPKSLPVLPEEQNYLSSIAQLSKAVETSDEFVMRPGFRVNYERNLAVTDGAISAMQKQVRRNPKDENAKRILFASYQNKIELLNTVAEKSQMIASLR